MKVRVTRGFKFSPDGNSVVDVEAGTEVEGRCADVALQSGWGEEVRAAQPKPEGHAEEHPKHEAEAEEKALESAPHNKALHRAPHHKRK
jgi:hypothetical protein